MKVQSPGILTAALLGGGGLLAYSLVRGSGVGVVLAAVLLGQGLHIALSPAAYAKYKEAGKNTRETDRAVFGRFAGIVPWGCLVPLPGALVCAVAGGLHHPWPAVLLFCLVPVYLGTVAYIRWDYKQKHQKG